MTEPSITCIACNRTSHNPADVTQRYCGNCHADAHGSIIWTRGEREHFKTITGSIGDAPIFKILPARLPGRYTLMMASIYGVIFGDYTRYDPVPQAFNTITDAKYNASIMLARFMRKMFFSQPSLGTSGGVPVTEELVENLAEKAEEGYEPKQLRTPHSTPLAAEAATILRDYLHYHDQIFQGTEYSDTFAEYIKGGLRKELTIEHLRELLKDYDLRAIAQYYDTHDAVTGELLAAPAHQEES